MNAGQNGFDCVAKDIGACDRASDPAGATFNCELSSSGEGWPLRPAPTSAAGHDPRHVRRGTARLYARPDGCVDGGGRRETVSPEGDQGAGPPPATHVGPLDEYLRKTRVRFPAAPFTSSPGGPQMASRGAKLHTPPRVEIGGVAKTFRFNDLPMGHRGVEPRTSRLSGKYSTQAVRSLRSHSNRCEIRRDHSKVARSTANHGALRHNGHGLLRLLADFGQYCRTGVCP